MALVIIGLSITQPKAEASCFIDIAVCGFQNPGQASEFMNTLPTWTANHNHMIGSAGDGTFFLEATLFGKSLSKRICYAEYITPAGIYSCPVSGNTATIKSGTQRIYIDSNIH